MPIIQVVDREGVEHSLSIPTGTKLMESLRDMSDGVEAICGGVCSCATCHVYLPPEILERMPPPQMDEQELLSGLLEGRDDSRLSCQIIVTEEFNGCRVVVAPEE